MSFPSPSQAPKLYPTQNNFSSPNLYANYKKPDLSIQIQKSPQYHLNSNPYSQRGTPNHTFGQINNEMYTSGTSRPSNGVQTGAKLTQMTSDLAKLKQQLSKIMTQAGTMQRRPQSNNQPIHNKSSQQLSTQAFINGRYGRQEIANSVNQNLNKREESTESPVNGRSPASYHRITENRKSIPNQQPIKVTKIPPPTLTFGEKKSQKVIPSENGMSLFNSTNKFSSYGTSHDLKKSNQFESKLNKNPQKANGEYYFGKDYDIKPILKVKNDPPVPDHNTIDNVSIVNGNTLNTNTVNNQFKRSQNEYQNQYESPKIRQNVFIDSVVEVPTNQPSPFLNQPAFSPQKPESSYSSSSPATKKSTTNFSHQIIVNKIVNEELSKKIEQSLEISQLKKKKQEDDYQNQEKIIQLEHQKRRLKHQINSITLEKENLQMALKTQKAQKQALNKKYVQLQEAFKIVKFQLQESKTRYKILQRKLESEASRPKVITQPLSFDQALKQQIAEITKLKQQLEDKDEQIMRVKDINTSHRRQIESLHNQIKIEQLKAASQLNESQQKHSILVQDKENEIKTMKNLVITLESKLQCAIKENKSKDGFMVQHLAGKAKTGEEKEYIENFFKLYEIEFPTNKIADKLKEELTEIERLKKVILEMAGSASL